MYKSLYDLLGMKAKNSIFKSVFVTDSYTSEGYRIVEVEAYDDTFLNATATVTKLDNTTDKIFLKVYQYFNGEPVWISLYTDISCADYLVSTFYMKEWGLI